MLERTNIIVTYVCGWLKTMTLAYYSRYLHDYMSLCVLRLCFCLYSKSNGRRTTTSIVMGCSVSVYVHFSCNQFVCYLSDNKWIIGIG